MSRGAIDFISLMYNVDMQTSLIEMVRSSLILTLTPEYTQIDGGFDLMIQELEQICKRVSDNRCTIQTRVPIKEIHYVEDAANEMIRSSVRLVIGNSGNTATFDSVIVTTTARAASLIKFEPRALFVNKYKAFRQLHYDCATKIAHSFSRAFWYEENIRGGSSVTDLSIRFVFYNNFNSSANDVNDGGFILTSYVWATDALLWSALTKEEACEKSLQDLMQLHNRVDIHLLVTSCEVKNWCTDQYAIGAYALFTANQETNLDEELGKSIKDTVHFSGEHISFVHRWIEGAIQSSLRIVMHMQEEEFDVVIVDGGVLGMITALTLAKTWNVKRIAVLMSEDSEKLLEVAPFHSVDEKYYLSKASQIVLPLWQELEAMLNVPAGSLLNTHNGFVYLGQSSSKMAEICRNLTISKCTLLSSTQISNGRPFININQPALRLVESGFVNVTLLDSALRILVEKTPSIILRDRETFFNVKYISGVSHVRIETSRGSLNASKVIFLPGVQTKEMMNKFGLNLNINLYELPTCIRCPMLPASNITSTMPTWLFAPNDDDHYAGYPPDGSGYVCIEPRIVKSKMQKLNSSYEQTNKPDPEILKRLLTWVNQHMSVAVDSTNAITANDTVLDTILSDDGFILDYIPGFGQMFVLGTHSWSGVQYMPLFAQILAQLATNNKSSIWPSHYASLLPEFSVNLAGRIITLNPLPSRNTSKDSSSTLIYSLILIHFFIVFYSYYFAI
ncbi:unnamed protein product [Rotaria socialis]